MCEGICVRVCLCLCVCVSERGREGEGKRESERVCVFLPVLFGCVLACVHVRMQMWTRSLCTNENRMHSLSQGAFKDVTVDD